MIPNTISKVQMFSQVTKTSAICPHAIHWETIGDLEIFDRFRGFLLEEDLDFRPDALSSYKEHNPSSSKPTSDIEPTRWERG
jgi:hypothetical protein